MPRRKNDGRDLPPVVVSDRLLREIDSAVPDIVREDVTWFADVGTDTIEEFDINTFINAIGNDENFDAVVLSAFNDDEGIAFTLSIESTHSSFEYTCPNKRQGELGLLMHSIEGIFNAEHRWTYRIPEYLARPRWLFRSSKFVLGKQTTPFLSQLVGTA